MPFDGTQAKVFFKASYDSDSDMTKLSLAPGTDDKGTTTGQCFPITIGGAPTLHLEKRAPDAASDASPVPVTKGPWYLQVSYSSPQYPYAYDKDVFYAGPPDQEASPTLPKKGSSWLGNAYRIDVLTKDTRPIIACYGDSITQGFNSTPGTATRYPEVLGKLLDLPTLNLGVNGDTIWQGEHGCGGNIGPLQGIKSVIFLMGINDIIGGRMKSVDQYATSAVNMANDIKRRGMKIYLGTLLPATGNPAYDKNPDNEPLRKAINEWIKTKAPADGVIDFDSALADPEHPEKMRESYQSDWLHPNDAGYQKMAETAAAVLKKAG
jgi:lysophospholipase L1-like esterase